MEAAYRVNEAKRLSEVIDSVGESTSLDVLFPDGNLEQLSDKGHDRMRAMFKRFGPRAGIVKPRLEGKYFDSLEF